MTLKLHASVLDTESTIRYNNTCHESCYTSNYRIKGDVSGDNHSGARSDCRTDRQWEIDADSVVVRRAIRGSGACC